MKLKFDLSQEDLDEQIRNFLKMLIDVLVVNQRNSVLSLKQLAEKYSVGHGKGFKNRNIKLHDFLLSKLLKISDKSNDKVDKKSQYDFRLPLSTDSSSQYDNPKKLHENSADNQKAEIPQETIDNFKKLLDEKLFELAKQPSESLEAIEERKLGPIEFELLEKFLIDTNKPILRVDTNKDHDSKLSALKAKLSCETKTAGFVGVTFGKLDSVKSRLTRFYENIIVGRTNEVNRVVYFSAPDKKYYLDYTKLSHPDYAKLRELPWMRRLIYVIENNSEYLSELLDKPLPSQFLQVFNKESEHKFHLQINLGLLDPSLGKTINNDEIIVELENNQDSSKPFSFSTFSRQYLPSQQVFTSSNQDEVPSFTQIINHIKNKYWSSLYDTAKPNYTEDPKCSHFWSKFNEGIKKAISAIEESLN